MMTNTRDDTDMREIALCKCEFVTVTKCDGYLLVTVEGKMRKSDTQAFLTMLSKSPELPTDVPTLFDMRDVDFTDLSSDDIQSFAAALKRYPERREARCARLVGCSLGFGMMRMYQTWCEVMDAVAQNRMLITYSIDEALDWMGATDRPCNFAT